MTLKPRKRAAPELGPVASVAAAHVRPTEDTAGLAAILEGTGLKDTDKDGLLEQDCKDKNMWLSTLSSDTAVEFEFAEAVPLSAIELWNYNVPWQTQKGLRQADVAVSVDGSAWQTVLKSASFKEADGTPDYDEPTVLKLDNVRAKKVRFEHLSPLSACGQVGISKVLFHKSTTQ